MKHWEFWNALREIARRDQARTIPEASIDRAKAIYRTRKPSKNVLQLRPAFMGMMRDAGSQPLIFENEDGQFAELTKTQTEDGLAIAGFSSAGVTGTVRMFAENASFETSIEDGEFSFDALPAGCYTMSLDHEGAHFWILDLSLKDNA